MKKMGDYFLLFLILLLISAVIGLLWPIFEFLGLIGRQIIVQHHVVWKDATADYLTNYIFAVIATFISLVIDIHRDGIIADYLDFRKKKRNGVK